MDLVGIDTQSYFTRVFKQEFGETPTAFVANAKRKKI
jgi:AraC-like DNA-binding protein